MKYITSFCTDDFQQEVERILTQKAPFLFDFFEVEPVDLSSVSVYLYATKEELWEGLKQRGFEEHPDYLCACYKDEDRSLNFFEPSKTPTATEWSREEYRNVIFHEEIHAITHAIYGTLPEWLSEGIAKYLDGTYQKGIKWLMDQEIHSRPMPTMDELTNQFGYSDYDSYDYAYFIVSYLIETLGKSSFLKKIQDPHFIEEETSDLLLHALTYYNEKYYRTKYYNRKTGEPQWLFHGTPVSLEKITPQLSHDSSYNLANIDHAVFVTPSLLMASSYAFKDQIKQSSADLPWNFDISLKEEIPVMTMENVRIEEEMEGYLYVFANQGQFRNEPVGSEQYKAFQPITPFACHKIRYADFKDYYAIKESGLEEKGKEH